MGELGGFGEFSESSDKLQFAVCCPIYLGTYICTKIARVFRPGYSGVATAEPRGRRPKICSAA